MLRRLVPATAAAALLLTGLTACSAQNANAGDCASPLKHGALSDGVTVLGQAGEAPQVSIPEDVRIETSQRTVVSETEDAHAARVADGTLVGLTMNFYDASSGKQIYSTDQDPAYMVVSKESETPITNAVLCAAVGDRVVLALSPDDSAPLAMQLGGTAGASIVGVLDVDSAAPLRARGPERGLPSGFPAVVTNDEGRPGIVLPPTAAPKGTESAVRIAGDGAEVKAGSSVVAQVLTVDWDGRIADSSTWDSTPVMMGDEKSAPQSGYAFRAELTGKKVGSQVVIIENADGGAKVHVVDILGVA